MIGLIVVRYHNSQLLVLDQVQNTLKLFDQVSKDITVLDSNLNNPSSIVLATDKQLLKNNQTFREVTFIADTDNHKIKLVDMKSLEVTLYAGFVKIDKDLVYSNMSFPIQMLWQFPTKNHSYLL